MTLLLFLFGGSTVASTGTPAVATPVFGVCGPTVQNIFPVSTVISSYSAISKPTNLSF